MRRTRWLIEASALAAGLFLACGVVVRAQENGQDNGDPAYSGMSREMKIGIRFYESGDDLQAMDRFMDVLTQGDPAERSMANEYINLITHRMNTGEKGPAPRRPASLTPAETVVEPASPDASREAARPAAPAAVVAQAAAPRAPMPAVPVEAAPAPAPRAAPAEPALTAANKEVMKGEIKARLRAWLDDGLAKLREIDGARVLMFANGDPQAVAIPSTVLFQQGIAFQKDALPILDALTKVVFGLSGAQVVILPEGTTVGDAKVLDMRRTMGISAHLFAAGVAPPRVRVNLLNTQVDIPKPLQDFKGIVVVFVYNQPLTLTAENMLADEAGPPLSLGLYPEVIRPAKGEGAVIEFSVQDPPAGLVSWRFQLLEPSDAGGADLAPLQEVFGGSPVYHQIFWNGRRNYFGEFLPAGRYEAVLTATDSKNRQRAIHKWIQVEGTPAKPAPAIVRKSAAAPAASASAVSVEAAKPAAPGAPPAELPGDKTAASPLIKEIKPAKPVSGHAKKLTAKKRAPSPKKLAKAKPKAEPEAQAGAGDEAASAEASASAQAPEAASAASAGGDAAAAKPAAAKAQAAKPSSYDLTFKKDTYQLTKEGEKTLMAAADAAGSSYQQQPLQVQGYAQTGETNASKLAETRAKMVAGLLINRYQVDPKRIQMGSSVADKPDYRVQVVFSKEP